MRIAYLDQPTYLSAEFSARVAALAEFEVYQDRPDDDEAVRRLSGCDLAIVEWTRLSASILSRVRRLRYVTLATTSFDMVDLDAAAAAGITVANCPSYASQSVAEHTFALLLAVGRRLCAADRAVRDGASHLYGPFLGAELRGRTLGLVGTGRIASAVARIASGFGMPVIAANRTGQAEGGLALVGLDDLLARSDVVSLHLPLDRDTAGILNAGRLARLRPSAILINTSRGALLDQDALAAMLSTGRLAGAGLDDLVEPGADVLRQLDNVVLSPGTGWYTDVSRAANLSEIYGNISSYLAGEPTNVLTRPDRRGGPNHLRGPDRR